MLDDESFVVGAIDNPGACRHGGQGSGGSVLRGRRVARWAGGCKRQGARAEQRPEPGAAARRRGPRRVIIGGPGCGLGGRGCGSHRLGQMQSAVSLGLTWKTDLGFLRPRTRGAPSDLYIGFSVNSICGFAWERGTGIVRQVR